MIIPVQQINNKLFAHIRLFVPALVFVVSLLIVAGCVDRPRDNPLDPQNPKTHGKPTGMRLASREHQVTISWDRLNILDLIGMNIYRLAPRDSVFVKLNSAPIPGREFVDRDVEYGLEYTYRITAETKGYESPESDATSIIPGPTYTWVADSYIGQVIRYCHDMRYELIRVGVIAFPTAIAASSSERAAWVLERYSNRLYKISDSGKIEVVVHDFDAPTALAVNQTTGDVWVAQRSHKTVTRLDSQGNLQRSFATFDEPIAVDVDDFNGECWVADRTARTVSRIPLYGQGVFPLSRVFLSPQDVATDPENGAIWIADSSCVLRYDYSGHGSWIVVDGFFWASILAPCKTSNCCWIVDLCESGKPAKLLKMDAQGNVLFELAEFGNPRGISVNSFDGSCLVADTGYGRLVRVSSDGESVEFIQNVSGPQDVSVENH